MGKEREREERGSREKDIGNEREREEREVERKS